MLDKSFWGINESIINNIHMPVQLKLRDIYLIDWLVKSHVEENKTLKCVCISIPVFQDQD